VALGDILFLQVFDPPGQGYLEPVNVVEPGLFKELLELTQSEIQVTCLPGSPAVSQVVEDVAEISPIPINKNPAVAVFHQREPAREHGGEERGRTGSKS
jgi:hypothetical protein